MGVAKVTVLVPRFEGVLVGFAFGDVPILRLTSPGSGRRVEAARGPLIRARRELTLVGGNGVAHGADVFRSTAHRPPPCGDRARGTPRRPAIATSMSTGIGESDSLIPEDDPVDRVTRVRSSLPSYR